MAVPEQTDFADFFGWGDGGENIASMIPYQLPESLLHAHFVIASPEPNCSRAEEIITWFSPLGRTGRVSPAYRWHPVLCSTYFAIQQKILTEKQEPQLILSGRTSIILAFLKDKLVVKLDINKP